MRYSITTFAAAPFDIIDGDRGKAYPKQQDFSDAGYCLFLSAANVTKSGFEFGSCQFIDEQKDSQLRKGKLEQYDVVLTTRGTLGNVAYYDSRVPFEHLRINSGMVLLRCERSKILPKFLFAFLRSTSFQAQVNRMRSGVAQPQLPIRDMKRIELPLPTPRQQERIVEAISAYDDLIENNRRRIVLLKEAGRLLYREWFVRFRFPGHEHVKIVQGLPEGWERRTLAALAEDVGYGFTASADFETDGPKFLRITDIVDGPIEWDRVPRCSIPETKLEGFLLNTGDIVVARTGATTGWARRVGRLSELVVFASYLVRFRFGETYRPEIAATYMQSDSYKAFVKRNLGGAAQPNASAKVLGNAIVPVPPAKLQSHFVLNVRPTLDQIDILMEQNQALAKGRDLLLPRLMNGKIAV